MNRIIKLLAASSLCLAFTSLVGCGSSDSGTSEPKIQKSTAVTSLESVGVGVDNLAQSVAFFEDALGMVELERIQRENRTEAIMQAGNGRGAKLALMEFNDGVERNNRQNPGKLVFYTENVDTLAASIVSAGGRITVEPTYNEDLGVTVGFARGINENIIEMTQVSQNGTFLSAIGIGVSDLESAYEFYVNVIGFEEDQFLPIEGFYDEYILTSTVANTPALVIMTWDASIPRNYKDNSVKILLNTDDPEELASAISNSGYRLTQEPTASTEADLNGATVGYAKDEDGTLIEIRDSTE